MLLTRLEIDRFRNLKTQHLEPHPRFNLFFGANGQGKTNLLEAVAVLGSLRSFRASRLSELLRFGEERARLRGEIEAQTGLHQELEVELRASGRRALVNGKPARSATSYLGRLSTVLFAPEDLQLPRGAPGERRKLLDRAIARSWPAYYEVQRGFQRALQTRNRVLRERGARLDELLDVYDRQLAELGSRVVASRRRYTRVLAGRVERVFAEVSGGDLEGGLRYVTGAELERAGEGRPELEQALLELLRRSRGVDLARGATTVGPQTDDLDFQLGGRSARAFGSQGQLRGLVLSVKLAEILDSFERSGSYPVLLLDDVSSELDAERNGYLFEFIKKISCQTFLTTTRPELMPLSENVFKYQVVDGEIRHRPEA